MDTGPYRLRKPQDAAWPPPQRAYGGAALTPWHRLAQGLLVLLRLIVPVVLLMTLLAGVYLYSDAPLPAGLMPAMAEFSKFSVSDLLLPLAWSVIHLTNRRYGASYAGAQLLIGLAAALLVALVNPGDIDHWTAQVPALSARALAAFGGAFLLANLAAIVFFDSMRGPRWWSAPLAAGAAASVLFSLLYYPAAFAGTADWSQSALAHGALFLGESVVLLFAYWLLRPAMRPLPGLNGY